MKTFDSEITDRGTVRKVIYTRGGNTNAAKSQAMKDITEDRNCNKETFVKPFKRRRLSGHTYRGFKIPYEVAEGCMEIIFQRQEIIDAQIQGYDLTELWNTQ